MTTTDPDPYAILGVAPNATQAEISYAYRALLRRLHPDTRVAPNDDAQSATSDTTLQQVIAAYTVLRDPARRADHDRKTGPPALPVRHRGQQRANPYDVQSEPPIIAGPVRWHRAP